MNHNEIRGAQTIIPKPILELLRNQDNIKYKIQNKMCQNRNYFIITSLGQNSYLSINSEVIRITLSFQLWKFEISSRQRILRADDGLSNGQ